MSKFPQKQQDLMNAARDLFYKYGVRRVSIEEICKNAQVSKMTFYKFYKNKNELVVHLLDYDYRDKTQWFIELFESDIPFSKKFKEFFNMKIEAAKMMNTEFLHDLIKNPIPEVNEYMMKRQTIVNKTFMDCLARAQQKNEIRPTIKPEFLMFLFQHVLELSTNEQIEQIFTTPEEITAELLNFMFYGLMPIPEDES